MELERRYRNGELDVINSFKRSDICLIPEDLFVVNKICAYDPFERPKDLQDIMLVLEREKNSETMKKSIKNALKKFSLYYKYQEVLGDRYPL